MVDDSLIPKIRLELKPIQETIREQSPDIREDSKHNNPPPRPPIKRQAPRQTVIESQKGPLHRPSTGKENIRKAPLRFRIARSYLFPIRRFGLVETLHALEDPSVLDLSAFEDVGCEEAEECEDDEVVVDF